MEVHIGTSVNPFSFAGHQKTWLTHEELFGKPEKTNRKLSKISYDDDADPWTGTNWEDEWAQIYDNAENDIDYWDTLQLLQEAENLIESQYPDDIIAAVSMVDDIKHYLDQLGSHLDLSVPHMRLNQLEKKIERYFS